MTLRPAFAIVVCLLSAASVSQRAAAAAAPFDGRWNVVLVCADTTDKRGLVKGYQYIFSV